MPVRHSLAPFATSSAIVLSMTLMMSGTAQAQAATGARPAASADTLRTLDEVVVTAQRRSEDIQTVPLTASVLNAAGLRKNEINQIDDLQRATPSLSVTDNGVTKYVNIRGIGLGVSAPGVANGVAYEIDGLFLPNAPLYSDDPYFDVDHVEILRGPQGTLVGQSSTGGAIFIVSKTPKLNQLGGDIEQTFGNYDELRTVGALNIPINDKWAARAAFEIEDRDSFYKFVQPTGVAAGTQSGNRPGDLNRDAARFSVYGRPYDDLEVTLRTEFQRKRSGGTTGKPIPGDPVDTAYLAQSPAKPFELSYDAQEYDDTDESESSVELKWHINPDLTLRSISGYTTGRRRFAQDNDGSAVPALSRVSNIFESDYSQEFNLLSGDKTRFQWVVGIFELYQRLGGDNVILANTPPASSTVVAHGDSGNDSLGVFGQGSYQITDQLRFTLGLRYSRDRLANFSGAHNAQNGRQHSNAANETTSAVTGKAALDYKLTPGEFFYVSASRGYKAGGFNDSVSKFLPEFVWDYEGGLKSTLFNNRVRTQIDAYYNNYSNIQVPVYDPALAFTDVSNGTSAVIYGVEAQADARFGQFGIDASVGYNHTRLNQISLVDPRLLPFGGSIPVCPFFGPCTFDFTSYTRNLSGKQLTYAPSLTAHVGVEYTFLVARGELTPRLNLSYQSRQYATLFEDIPADVIPAHALVDALVTYRVKDQWRAEVYATNLFDRAYIAGKFQDQEFYGAPRQVGVRLGYSF